jgi:hypothetical protein
MLIEGAALPPSSVLALHVDRLLTLHLRALPDTVPLLGALEAKSFVLVSLTLLRGKSTRDGVEINSANVRRRPTYAYTIATASASTKPKSFTTSKALGALDLLIFTRALPRRPAAPMAVTYGRYAPYTTQMRRVSHKVIHEVL